jgi:hypothetical protein
VTNFKRIFSVPILCMCLAAAGCGGEDDEGEPIPSEQADALLQQLDVVQNRLDNGSVGACQDIFTHAESPNQPAVDGILTQVPNTVDPEVRSALQESFARLWDLVGQECDQREADQPEPEPEPEPEPIPEETEEEPTETVPPEEEETPPPEEEETLPPEGDGDNDGEVPPADGGGRGGGVGPGGEGE